MKEIILRLKKRSYPIVITNSFALLPQYVERIALGNCGVIITNSKIKRLYANRIISSLKKIGVETHTVLVKDSEASKSLKTTSFVIEKILKIDKKKKIFVIALGGGVIGDLAGFVSAVYKRGVPFIQVPTTLLAQVDSAIGGKTAVDVKEAKNIIGAFYQPKLVYSNISTLKTLPKKEVSNGLAEIIKYAMIKDKRLFVLLEKHAKDLLKNKNARVWEDIICDCAKIKAKVVSEDERETKGRRSILNFGHTFGHAIETAASYSKTFTHGQGVAVGMLIACNLAISLKLCDEKIKPRLESIIKKAGLPVCAKKIKLKNVLAAMQHDKKFIRGKNRFILPLKIGKVKVFENIDENAVKKACEKNFLK